MNRSRKAQALMAGAAIAGGTQAYADFVRFDNPTHGDAGHFHLRGPLGTENWLDITKSVFEQPGLPLGPASIGQGETADWGLLEGYHPTLELGVGGVQDWFLVPATVYLG